MTLLNGVFLIFSLLFSISRYCQAIGESSSRYYPIPQARRGNAKVISTVGKARAVLPCEAKGRFNHQTLFRFSQDCEDNEEIVFCVSILYAI